MIDNLLLTLRIVIRRHKVCFVEIESGKNICAEVVVHQVAKITVGDGSLIVAKHFH